MEVTIDKMGKTRVAEVLSAGSRRGTLGEEIFNVHLFIDNLYPSFDSHGILSLKGHGYFLSQLCTVLWCHCTRLSLCFIVFVLLSVSIAMASDRCRKRTMVGLGTDSQY